MQKRNIITAENRDWLVGYSEIRKSDDVPWERALHSEWVFSLPIQRDAQGKRAHDNLPIPHNNIPIIIGNVGERPLAAWTNAKERS